MASKIILDSERLLEETLVSPTEACRHFPGSKRSRPALERDFRKGSRGSRLESILICGKRYTSLEAIDRYIRAQLQTEPDRAPPKQGSISQTELDKRAKRFGL